MLQALAKGYYAGPPLGAFVPTPLGHHPSVRKEHQLELVQGPGNTVTLQDAKRVSNSKITSHGQFTAALSELFLYRRAVLGPREGRVDVQHESLRSQTESWIADGVAWTAVFNYVERMRQHCARKGAIDWPELDNEAAMEFIYGSRSSTAPAPAQAPKKQQRSQRGGGSLSSAPASSAAAPPSAKRLLPAYADECKAQGLCIKFQKGSCPHTGDHEISPRSGAPAFTVRHACHSCGAAHGRLACPSC